MPELLEVEAYAAGAEGVVGRTISQVVADDEWYVKGHATARELVELLRGTKVVGVRRIGKLMLLDTDGPVVGLRFGMTGRLLVDGVAAIDRLEYSGHGKDRAWTRFAIEFTGGGTLAIVDPRRLGGVSLDPDETALGPDATSIRLNQLECLLLATTRHLKAVLLDQQRIAGLGNLLVDETLFRAGIAPDRRSCDLNSKEIGVIHLHIGSTIDELRSRGGSHTGDLQEARVPGASCPLDGSALTHGTVGGRSTYWCARHQV